MASVVVCGSVLLRGASGRAIVSAVGAWSAVSSSVAFRPGLAPRLRSWLGAPSALSSFAAVGVRAPGLALLWRPWGGAAGRWVVALVAGGSLVPGSAIVCRSFPIAADLFALVLAGGALPPRP